MLTENTVLISYCTRRPQKACRRLVAIKAVLITKEKALEFQLPIVIRVRYLVDFPTVAYEPVHTNALSADGNQVPELQISSSTVCSIGKRPSAQ